jgi:hypothetical protein
VVGYDFNYKAPNIDPDEGASTLLDFVPLIGTIKGAYEALTGRDVLTKRRLSKRERVLNVLLPGGKSGAKGVGRIVRYTSKSFKRLRVAEDHLKSVSRLGGRWPAVLSDATLEVWDARDAVAASRAAKAVGRSARVSKGFSIADDAQDLVKLVTIRPVRERPAASHGVRPARSVARPRVRVSAAAASETTERSILKVGMRGEDVRALQRLVGARPDGIYGQETRRRVELYQRRIGAQVDGVWGPQSRHRAGV